MQKEIATLEGNDTWELTELPPHKKPISCKGIYKVKYIPYGTVDKYKARIVVKGYTQVEGEDFYDSFSPVAKVDTIRLVFALAAARGWYVHKIDIKNAFLHGYLDEDVHMKLPPGYNSQQSSLVFKCKRSLYV